MYNIIYFMAASAASKASVNIGPRDPYFIKVNGKNVAYTQPNGYIFGPNQSYGASGAAGAYVTITSSGVSVVYENSSVVQNNNSVTKGTSKTVFPEDPRKFNPEGLVRKEYNNGKIIKWHDPKTGKAVYEWNADPKNGDHYHVTPDGKNRMPHPDTGDTHIKPRESVPKINK